LTKAKRKVAVFTGNRAEYGLQYPILRAINRHPNLDYSLLVSGAHLDTNFGSTLDEIRDDGFHIDAEVKIEMDATSLFATAQAIGSGVLSISHVLNKLKPDMMVVYGDRVEGLAAVIASSQMNIPTAHIEGGDLTEGGALDDSVRHSMTKLAHLHFTTNKQATNRILAMGEESWRVHTVGFPAIDLISEGRFGSAKEVVEKLNLDLSRPVMLFTQHSVSTEFSHAAEQLTPSLVAIERLSAEGVQTILTYPNNDAGGQAIIEKLEVFGATSIPGVQVFRSLGRHLYHGVLALARDPLLRVACIGNSSSGIKETPAFGCPTVNIGSRQNGRLSGENVLSVNYDADEISSAMRKCLYDKDFRKRCLIAKNPYWLGDAGPKIAEVLSTVSLDQKLIRKCMTLQGEMINGWFR
jgi:UDP-N-acetylglucosamine 2-epimerase (non-hydrolysing)/GDP/UDP-N,N'-diacetylbacillosamine 2-epimerase (hydrolysing)